MAFVGDVHNTFPTQQGGRDPPHVTQHTSPQQNIVSCLTVARITYGELCLALFLVIKSNKSAAPVAGGCTPGFLPLKKQKLKMACSSSQDRFADQIFPIGRKEKGLLLFYEYVQTIVSLHNLPLFSLAPSFL